MIDEYLLKIKDKDRKMVVILAPILGGLILGYLFVINPALGKIGRLKNLKAGLSSKEATYTNIIEMEKKLQAQKERLAPVGDKAELMETLNAVAVESGLTVLSMTPDEKKPAGTYLECVSVRIDAEGNYHQVGEFASRVENMKKLVKVMSADISTEGSSEMANPGAAQGGARVAQKTRTFKISIVVGQFGAQKDAL